MNYELLTHPDTVFSGYLVLSPSCSSSFRFNVDFTEKQIMKMTPSPKLYPGLTSSLEQELGKSIAYFEYSLQHIHPYERSTDIDAL